MGSLLETKGVKWQIVSDNWEDRDSLFLVANEVGSPVRLTVLFM